MPVDPDTEPHALLVQDSGMVPVSTQISIVNPETNQLCLVGEYGEIWVQSEANAHSFYGSKERLDAERFNGRTVDGDPNARYVRTGDLGFLHNVTRPIGANGAPVDMQVLFVLGSIGDTFEVNGLNHFSMDIESSIERCHRNIVPGGWYGLRSLPNLHARLLTFATVPYSKPVAWWWWLLKSSVGTS